MAQHDYVIANGTGAAVRSDLNNALAAIVSQNSGATEPATTYAYQFWADTTTSTLKLRNSANSAWIELMQLDGTLTMEDGTEALPGLSFRNDLDTGLWRPGANQLAISTNAVERVEFGASEVVFNDGGANYDFRVEGDTNANLLFVDASADAIGVGTSSPTLAGLQVEKYVNRTDYFAPSGSYSAYLGGVDNTNTKVWICVDSGYNQASAESAGIFLSAKHVDLGGSEAGYTIKNLASNNSLVFSRVGTAISSGNATETARMTLTAGGSLGVGTTSPGSFVGSVNVTIGSAATTTTTAAVNIYSGNATYGGLYFADGTVGDQLYRGSVEYKHDVDALAFGSAGTERARIDSSGRLLLGTSSARSNVREGTDNETPKIQFESATNDYSEAGLSIINNSSSGFAPQLWLGRSASDSIGGNALVSSGRIGSISFNAADGTNFIQGARIQADIDGTSGSGDLPTRLSFSTTADGASSPTERMRIDNAGNLLLNATSVIDSSMFSANIKTATNFATLKAPDTSSYMAWQFQNSSGTRVGYIQFTTTATTYSTSSDYRLKDNVELVTDGITRLQQLKPARFNFIADPDTTVDGFLAHEVQDVVPEAITGDKDAVDADGNPIYQGIDQSKLVPLLTAALQEAVAKIESLEARLTAAGI